MKTKSKEYTIFTDEGDGHLSIYRQEHLSIHRQDMTIVIENWDGDELLCTSRLDASESNRLSRVLETLLWIGD